MAVFTVTTLSDSGIGSLRQALDDADANPGTDEIVFDASLVGGNTPGVDDGLIVLTMSTLAIESDLTINGDVNGDGIGDITIDGDLRTPFEIRDGVTTILHGLTITNGFNFLGGGLRILNADVTVSNSAITGNGGYYGGGIFLTDSTLTLVNSLVAQNNAIYFYSYNGYGFGGLGGGIDGRGDVTLINSTISGNQADVEGDGISLRNSTLSILSSTVVDDLTLPITTSTVENSIIAGLAPDLTATRPGSVTATGLVAAGLAPLADNGGAALTHAILPGSLAIGQGDASLLPADAFDVDSDGNTAEDLPLDANRSARVDDQLDSGAVEFSDDPVRVSLSNTLGGLVGIFDQVADALAQAGDGFTVELTTLYGMGVETLSTPLNGLTFVTATGTQVDITLANGTATDLFANGDGSVSFTGNANDNLFTGTSTGDSIDGGGGRNTMSYQNSAARVAVDLAFGTAAFGHAAGDTLTNITSLVGSPFNDRLDGTGDPNALTGGTGNDNISGRAGADTLLGGDGSDQLNGGNGPDTADGGADDDLIFGNAGNDSIAGAAGFDTVFAGSGADTVTGGDDADQLSGQSGFDELSGGLGADILRGGSGNDLLTGGEGADTLFGNGNNDTLQGDAGADVLQGAQGADVLIGGAGDDTLTGSVGGDRLEGGTGNDVMNGGGADGARDTFVFAPGFERDRVNAFDQAGTDRLELDAALWATYGTLTGQQVVDIFGSPNATGTILTLDFGGGDVLEVQNATGIDATTLGTDIFIV